MTDARNAQPTTVAELGKYIGDTARWEPGEKPGISFEVEITDAKQAYGRVQFCVQPVAGRGDMWVTMDSLVFPG